MNTEQMLEEIRRLKVELDLASEVVREVKHLVTEEHRMPTWHRQKIMGAIFRFEDAKVETPKQQKCLRCERMEAVVEAARDVVKWDGTVMAEETHTVRDLEDALAKLDALNIKPTDKVSP